VKYTWWVFLHHLGVAGFLLAHGTSTAMLFRLRGERDRSRIQTLISFSGSTVTAMYVSLGVILVGGIGGAVVGKWFGFWWPWVAIGLLLAIVGAMSALARPYYQRVSESLDVRVSGVPRRSDEELDAILRSRVPLVIAWTGFLGLVAIIWLMVFKPW
jgi:uncharacterized membrane protein